MKCSKHPDKEASAICEKCNLLYCGSCALSSNGKCPKCGNTLRSPQSVLSYEIQQDELYRGRGQPSIIEAVNSLYMEPERAMRRLREYPSLFTGVINITILYLIITVLRVLLIVIIASGIIHLLGSNTNLFEAQTIFALIIGAILYFGVLIFLWLFSSFIFFLPSKLLGGKGEFVQQASVLSYMMLALFPLGIFSLMLAAIPVVGLFISYAVGIAVFLYAVFLVFLSIREINEFNTVKAVISLIISIAIFVFLLVAFSVVLALIFYLPNIGNLLYPSF